MIQTLTLSEMEEIAAGYDLKEVAEAFLVGAGVGAIVSGGNPVAAAGAGLIAVCILYL